MTNAENKALCEQSTDNEWTPCMKKPVVVHVRQQRPGETHVHLGEQRHEH